MGPRPVLRLCRNPCSDILINKSGCEGDVGGLGEDGVVDGGVVDG